MGGSTSTFRKQLLRSMWAIGLVAMVLLSGCAGKSKTAGGAQASQTVQATFDAETGAIKGTVFTDELIPVGGAQVGLQREGLSATETNAAGEFAFSQVAPGEVVVIVSALGYEQQTKQVTVVAGEVTTVEITVVPQSVPGLAYARVIGPLPGKFFCGFSVGIAGPCKVAGFGGPLTAVEDGYQSIARGESNIFILEDAIEGNKSVSEDQLAMVVVEVTWSATTGAAQWLSASIEQVDETGDEPTRNGTYTQWAGGEGSNPLKVTAEPGKNNPGAFNGETLSGEAPMPLDARGFTIGIFPTGDPDSPAYPFQPAAYTEQPFNVWVTLFYNEKPAADYTVLVE